MASTSHTVPPELDGAKLDRALRTLASLSWSRARDLVTRGKVVVDGVRVTSHEHVVRAKSRIDVVPHARKVPEGEVVVERSMIVHFDPHVVVVRKPAGLSTVPFEDGERGTLDQQVARLLPRSHRGPPGSLGVVQRLDKETSGLLVFARTFAAKKVLASQFRAHAVTRRYLGIAHGDVRAARIESRLVTNRGDGLRGSARHASERIVGQIAVTYVEPVERLDGATLVSCRLETGRTHQIRIHLAEAGHPLLGERVYTRSFGGAVHPAPRVMLHAAELGFVHPATGTSLHFEDDPPADFKAVLARLRAKR